MIFFNIEISFFISSNSFWYFLSFKIISILSRSISSFNFSFSSFNFWKSSFWFWLSSNKLSREAAHSTILFKSSSPSESIPSSWSISTKPKIKFPTFVIVISSITFFNSGNNLFIFTFFYSDESFPLFPKALVKIIAICSAIFFFGKIAYNNFIIVWILWENLTCW